MKTMIVCGIAMLMCVCCRDTGSPRAAQKRRDQVGKIIKTHYRCKYAFEVRGPLTLMQFEKELRESYGEAFELRKKVYGQIEETVDSAVGRKCTRIRGLSREGDELYFFTSDKRSWSDLAGIDGYVLVRKRELIDLIVKSIN